MRWLRRIAWVAGAIVVVVFAVVGGAVAWIDTAGGKAWLATAINQAAADQVHIVGLGGRLPFDPVIARIDMLDPDGTWASLDHVELEMAPWDLLRGQVTIVKLSADSIDVARPRVAAARQTPASPSPGVPLLPLSIDLRRLAVGSLSLPADLLGEPTKWTLAAAAHLAGRDVRLDADLAELDPSPAHAAVAFELSDGRTRAAASVDDPRGLLLHRPLGEAVPLHLVLADDDVSGASSEWQGHLSASVGDRAQLEATLRLAAERDSRAVTADGRFDGDRLLPANLQPLIAGGLGFHLALRDTDSGISVDGLSLDSAAVHAQGTALYRTRGAVVDAALHVNLSDLSPLSDLAGQPLTGAADVSLSAKGPRNAVRVNADVHGTDVAYGSHALAEMSARLAAAQSGHGYQFTAESVARDVRTGGGPLPVHLGDEVTMGLSGRSDAAMTNLSLSELTIASAGLRLTGDGSLDRRSQHVRAALRLSLDDLSRFDDASHARLRGRGQITATAEGSLAGSASVRVQGGFDDVQTGVAAADALSGERLRLDMNARRSDDGVVRIEDASLRMAGASLSVRGTFDPKADRLDGTVGLVADDLSVLRRAGFPAAGRVTVTANVAGRTEALAVDTRLDAGDLAWQGSRIDRASARLRGTLGAAPAGNLVAQVKSGDLTATVTGDAALSRDRKFVMIPRLRLAAGQSVMDARLRTALDSLRTAGEVRANVPSLAPWSSLAGLELAGRANMTLRLAADRGQAADFSLAVDDLRAAVTDAAPMQIHHLAATGSGADLLRRPRGHVEVRGDGLAAGAARMKSLRLAGRSDQPDRFGFGGDIAGDFRGPFALTAAGEAALTRGAIRVTVARLNGRIVDIPLRLQQPLQVMSREGGVSVADLGLHIGDGTITGRAAVDSRHLEVALNAERLPLALAGRLAGRDDIGGQFDARVALAGPAAQPRGDIALTARDLRAGPPRRDGAAVAFRATATVAPRQIGLNAAIDVAGNSALTLSGTVPVVFGLKPGGVAVPPDAPVDVQLRGGGELAALADFLPLAGDRLSGRYRLALGVGGTLHDPEIGGDAAIMDGHYENLLSGLVLDALTLDLGADRNRVAVRRLTATDGGKGRVDGSGDVSFAGAPTAELTVALNGFQALRRSDATLTVTGSTTVNGRLNAPNVVSRLTVDQAEFFIPDPPPSGAKKIPVTVIDSTTGEVLQRPEEGEAKTGGKSILLDVAVHVPGRTFVRGRGLDSEWQGDVQARGPADAPEVTGALNVVKGKLSFFGKDMNLTRGKVTFTGGHKIEPDLDVLAETATSDATFQVAATGTPEALKIKLSSTPPMPEDEILSRLIFGREMTRLTPAQGLQLAQAAATLSSGGPGMLDKVRQKLGLDVLNIGSMNDNDSLQPSPRSDSTGGNGGMANTGVSGGKYIANGVYVGAEQGLSGETRSKVEVEVLPHVNVESSAGTRSESVGLNWKYDY